MRPLPVLSLVILILATTLSAQPIWFDPPSPTAVTPVVAHVTFIGFTPIRSSVARDGRTVTITLEFPLILAPPPVTPAEYAVSLGVLPPGVYDVVVAHNVAEGGTLIVRDAAPPFELVPDAVPITGGEIVLRNDKGLISCAGGPVPIVCESFTVKVDGNVVKVVSPGPTEVVVDAPPHAAGAVDVTLERASDTRTATAALDYFDATKAVNAAFFEPVVFPALVNGAGAFGSQWTTDLALRNENELPLPVTSTFFDVVPAHGTTTVRGANAPAATIVYVPRQLAPKLFFNVLARDLSRQSEALGTEVPVFREKDLYDRSFSILLVPTEAKYRTALRIFRTDHGATVHLRIFSMQGDGVPLVDTTWPTGVIIIDLVATFPALAGRGPLRVEVDSGSAQRATGALVSVTNNETQHVTVIAPH